MSRLRRFQISITVLLAFAGALLATGCSQRAVSISAVADPAFAFEQPVTVQVGMIEAEGQPWMHLSEMTLQQRHVLAGVENALTRSGFVIVSQPPAKLRISVMTSIQSGERDAYRTVPVHEHTYGTVDTRRGPRRFHGTTSTSVVVPYRETYADRTIAIFAQPVDEADGADGAEGDPTVWIGRMRGPRSVIDNDVALAMEQLLQYWGATTTRTVRY